MSPSAGVSTQPDNRRKKTDYESMLERQLPQLAKRLQSTLDKLQNPALGSTNIMLSIDDWWKDVLARHTADEAAFAAHGAFTGKIPTNLFDTVLENCLENARKKKLAEPSIAITVEITPVANGAVLSITDTGSAIPSGAVDDLFHSPIANSRRGGYGIGLFQAFRQAAEQGYALVLASNRPGEVRFELRRELADKRT